MMRVEWIASFKKAFSDICTVIRDMMEKPRARALYPSQRRKLYDAAARTILHLLDDPPDNYAPGAAAAFPPDPPGDPAAHRRQAKRTLLRFLNLRLPSYVPSGKVADEIESIVDDIVDAAVAEVRRGDAAARAGATRNPA